MSDEKRVHYYDQLKEKRDFIENEGSFSREQLLSMSDRQLDILVRQISKSF
jgi:hypothetical protein